MSGINKIFPFAQPAVPPSILDDAAYSASSITTTTGYPGGSIAESAFMSKAQRQTSAISAGISEFMAVNESAATDVEDNLSPSVLAGIMIDAISNAPLVTHPKFENDQKVATTAFVQNALGSFSGEVSYGVNTVLNGSDTGKMIIAVSGTIILTLPLTTECNTGSKIFVYSNGNLDVIVERQGAEVIENGTLGSVTGISLNGFETSELTNRGTDWVVTGGNTHLNSSSQFEHSFVNPGFSTDPSGLITQFGTISPVFDSPSVVTFIALAKAWPTGLLSAQWSFAEFHNVSDTGGWIEARVGFETTELQFDSRFDGIGTVSPKIYWSALGH